MNELVKTLFPEMVKKIKNNRCPLCNNKIGAFRDALSAKEYTISGMCQECQDKLFEGLI